MHTLHPFSQLNFSLHLSWILLILPLEAFFDLPWECLTSSAVHALFCCSYHVVTVTSLTPHETLGSLRAASSVLSLASGIRQMLRECLQDKSMTVCVEEKRALFSMYVL